MKKGRKGGGLQIVTLCISTSLVLILLGLVVFSGLAANNLSSWVKENVNVTVTFDDNVSNDDAAKYCKQMQAKPYVLRLDYISRDQALKESTAELGTDPSEFLGVNPFVPSAELYLRADCANRDSLAWIEKDLKASKLVADVSYQEDLMDSVNNNLRIAMIAMLVLACLLTFISFSLINNMVRLSVYARRFTINTMKLVGASWSFIRRPFIVLAIWEGLIAALIAVLVLAGLAYVVYAYDPDFAVEMVESGIVGWDVLAITGGAVLVMGVLLSTVCVYLSVNRYLGMSTRKLYRI